MIKLKKISPCFAAGVATANPATTGATFVQMESALGAEIEAASQVGAMVGGILGGVSTGPVEDA